MVDTTVRSNRTGISEHRRGETRYSLQNDEKTTAVNVGTSERYLSLLGGGVLLAYGLLRRSTGGLALAALGGGLLYRGTTGHCKVYDKLKISTAEGDTNATHGIHVEQAVTINKSPQECYRFWRNFDNLPRFMQHLHSVQIIDQTHSRWSATGPAGQIIAWDAEIIHEKENELISWRSLEGADVENAGTVRFVAAPGGRGTEVHITLQYYPPAGLIGVGIAKLFGEEPSQQITDDLRRFKRLLETGEIPTTEGQPSGKGLQRTLLSPSQ